MSKIESIKDKLPKAFIENMKGVLTDAELEHFLDNFDDDPTSGIIINKNKINNKILDELTKLLDLKKLDEYTYKICNLDYVLKNEKIGKNIYHHAGCFYVSEPSAMKVIPKLDIKKDDKVLDLCSAPGGKSIQALMYLDENSGGVLFSNEIILSRCKILSSNIERISSSNVVILNLDPKDVASSYKNFFDKVIVDAPCSGEGMFRKSEVAIAEWSIDNVNYCSIRQKDIINDAIQCLKLDGIMVYSTCTFEIKEDEEIKEYILSLGNFELINEEKIYTSKDGEGQYIVSFKKIKNTDEQNYSAKFKQEKTSIQASYKKLYTEFEEEYLYKSLLSDNMLLKSIDENLYLINKNINDLINSKIYKNGIFLGSIVKKDFVPSHALSHYIDIDNYKNKLDLSSNTKLVEEYLMGREIIINNDDLEYNQNINKGYILLCYNNVAIGFGKAVISDRKIVIKNHYPKGLRNL